MSRVAYRPFAPEAEAARRRLDALRFEREVAASEFGRERQRRAERAALIRRALRLLAEAVAVVAFFGGFAAFLVSL